MKIMFLCILVFSCSSVQEKAHETPLQNVCPNFGQLNPSSEDVKKATYSLEPNKSPMVVIKNSNGQIKEYKGIYAFDAKKLKSLSELQVFKSYYLELCPDSPLPDYFSQTYSSSNAESINNKVSKCYDINCLKQIQFDSSEQKVEMISNNLKESQQMYKKKLFIDFILNSEPNNPDLLFRIHLLGAIITQKEFNLEKPNIDKKMELATEVLTYLKKSQEADPTKFKNALNYELYEEINSKVETLATLEKQKADSDGICSYQVHGKIIKTSNTFHIVTGMAVWHNNGIYCEEQKEKYKNKFAGLVENDAFGFVNPEKMDYHSPNYINVRKAYLIEEVTINNNRLFVFSKKPPAEIANKVAKAEKLSEKNNESSKKKQETVAYIIKSISKLNIKEL